MATVYIVRHAQASFGQSNYDQLSALGKKQSDYLGDYFHKSDLNFQKIITGTLVRHQQTANAVIQQNQHTAEHICTDQWNEFDFKSLVSCYLAENPDLKRTNMNRKDYFIALKNSMLAWQSGVLQPEGMETWKGFQQRIKDALDALYLCQKDDNILVVTSGGVIAMAISILHELPGDKMIDLNLQIKNTSITTLSIKKDRQVLAGFNGTPHLDSLFDKGFISYA